MGTLKKSKVKSKFKKLQDGGDTKSSPNDDDNWVNDQYYGRNTVAKTPNASKDPSSDIGERQTGKSSETKFPPNKFSEAKVPEKKAQTRGEAFKAARAAGKKTFDYNGKSYHTRTAEEDTAAKKATPAAKSSTSKSNSNTVNKIGEVEVIGKNKASLSKRGLVPGATYRKGGVIKSGKAKKC